MKVTRSTRLHSHLQTVTMVVLLVLFFAVLAWLSQRYHWQFDWTATSRHTLSVASQKIVQALDAPLRITAYISNNPRTRTAVKELIERYQRYSDKIELRFVDPFTSPGEVREKGITSENALLLEYQGRNEELAQVSETLLTAALQRLARAKTHRIAFLSGHGERNPDSEANQDYSVWVERMKKRGLQIETLTLAQQTQISPEFSALVIAAPRIPLLPAEVEQIQSYVANGGNLLWLLERGDDFHGLEPLAELWALIRLKGTVVDPMGQIFGIKQPNMVAISQYLPHPITQAFSYLTLFPDAVGLSANPPEPWQQAAVFATLQSAWSEMDTVDDNAEDLRFDEGQDIPGPLDLAVALTRPVPNAEDNTDSNSTTEIDAEVESTTTMTPIDNEATPATELTKPVDMQRVLLVGDSDFISNQFLGNGGNADLAMRMIDWLVKDDVFIDIPSQVTPDKTLNLSPNVAVSLGALFLFVLPMSLFSTGFWIWLRRRQA